jgi:hypothetical protein
MLARVFLSMSTTGESARFSTDPGAAPRRMRRESADAAPHLLPIGLKAGEKTAFIHRNESAAGCSRVYR